MEGNRTFVVSPRNHKNYSGKFYNLRHNLTKAARSTAPVDTGNLQMNAIYSMATPKGFRVVWDKRFAFYIPMVDNLVGTPSIKKVQNAGFVERGIGEVLTIIYQLESGSKKPFKGQGKNNLKRDIPLMYRNIYEVDPDSPMEINHGSQRMLRKFKESVAYSYKTNRDNLIPYLDSTGEVSEIDNS